VNNIEPITSQMKAAEFGTSRVTDEQLVLQCQQQDARAFEILVRRHQRSVYAMLYRMAPDWREHIDDLAQEVFIRMWRNISRLRNPRAFKSWLAQIVTNLFYDECRRRPRQIRAVSMDESIWQDDGDEPTRDIEDRSAGPEELLQRNELREVVQEAMTKLPEQFRTAVVLRELNDLSYEEIATITQTELGTVKSRIARGRAKVQEMIAPYLDRDKRAA